MQLMRTYAWTYALIAHTNEVTYTVAKREYVKQLSHHRIDTATVADDDLGAMLRAVKALLRRVVLVLASDADVLQISKRTLEDGLRAGWAWINGLDNFKDAAYDVTFLGDVTETSGLEGWLFFPSLGSSRSTPASRLFDAIVLYAHGAQRVLNRSGNVRNGSAVVEAMLSESFAGETGMVHLDSNGDLVESYSVFNYVLQDGVMSSVLVGECGGGLSSSDAGCAIKHEVRWPGGSSDVPSATRTLPLHRPPDHAHMHRCKRTNTYCAG